MKIIQEQWEDFKRQVIPKGASLTQVQEMRRAFYAGSAATVSIMCDTSKTKMSEEAAHNMLVGLAIELEAFMEAVVAGEA